MRRRLLALGLASSAAACGGSWIELQIVDPDLPYLSAGRDYDGLGVEAKAESCADREARYPAAALPATLSVLAGECAKERVSLRASAYLGDRRVAQSGWVQAAFEGSGAIVATATLADLPGRRVLYSSGFESGEPFGDAAMPLPVVLDLRVRDLRANVVTSGAISASQSAHLSGVATSSASRAYARVAATNVLVARGDELVFMLQIDDDAELLSVGVELELANGATARDLMLADKNGRPVDPANVRGREKGVRQQWAVDLTPAAGDRLVGLLLGFDARDVRPARGGQKFGVKLDDLAVVRP